LREAVEHLKKIELPLFMEGRYKKNKKIVEINIKLEEGGIDPEQETKLKKVKSDLLNEVDLLDKLISEKGAMVDEFEARIQALESGRNN
jgi:hypothetical protein